MTKQQMLDEVFSIGGNHKLEECKKTEINLVNYLKKNGNDPQVEDALSIIRIGIDDYENSNFETNRKLAAPIFERLLSIEAWDFYDIRILAIVVDYVETYERSCILTDIALNKLEEHAHENKYLHVKLIFHANVMLRLIRALYFETDGLNTRKTYIKLRDIFYAHFTAIKYICERGNFPVFYEVATIRRGIFYREDMFINEGLEALKKLDKPEIYRMLEDEVAEYRSYSKMNINKVQFDAAVGENIKKMRIERGMTQAKVASTAGLAVADISAMEGGKRTITSINLFKLGYVFNISADEFFKGIEIPLSDFEFKEVQIQRMIDIAEKFTEEEMASVMDMMKSIQEARRAR